ncbi:MAG: glycosyltransferase family 39 protein [bacterium]|nr:glycosyltransferase family 39 protein [bacterium]
MIKNPDPVFRLRPRMVTVGGGLAIAVLAAGWWPLLFLPLGASHDGRINGRLGLQVRNFLENGLSGSDFLASMAPFSPQPYVHHPPLLNLMQALIGSVFGQGEWQLHLIGYLAGLGTVVALIWLAGELSIGGGATLAALVLVINTPMFWIYARLGIGMFIMVVLVALWVRRLRAYGYETGNPYQPYRPVIRSTRPASAGLWLAAAAAAFSSWIGVLLVAALAGWGLRRPGFRQVSWQMGSAGAIAVLVTLVWAVTVGDTAELANHVAIRRQWPPLSDLVENYRWFYNTLFPSWFRWLMVPALVYAAVDRRTRLPAVSIGVALGVWTVVNPDSALIHDYWTFPLLVPICLGMAAGLDRLGSTWLVNRDQTTWGQGVRIATAAAVIWLAGTGLLGMDIYREAYFDVPSEAGRLLREVAPAEGQRVGWVAEGVDPLPRWVSYYWDLPAEPPGSVAVDRINPSDLVLVRTDRMPAQLQNGSGPVAVQGRYALFEAGVLAG